MQALATGTLTEQTGTVRQVVSARMPTKWGTFRLLGFERDVSSGSHRVDSALAIVLGDLSHGAPLLRIHSQCLIGEAFGSLRCDCNEQLEIAMRAIATERRGIIIYDHQECRSVGLMAELQTCALQDAGLDVVDAYQALGFMAECRDFGFPAAILHKLGISHVRLLSNNPDKARALVEAGVEVLAQVPCEAVPNTHSIAYLRAKKEKLGHTLSVVGIGQSLQSICAMMRSIDTEISNGQDREQFEFSSVAAATDLDDTLTESASRRTIAS